MLLLRGCSGVDVGSSGCVISTIVGLWAFSMMRYPTGVSASSVIGAGVMLDRMTENDVLFEESCTVEDVLKTGGGSVLSVVTRVQV